MVYIVVKLNFKFGMWVFDIGCGWGGMVFYLVENFDCDVVGIILLDEQLVLGLDCVEIVGLLNKIFLCLQDYCDVFEIFDVIVLVGMFEYVGVVYYKEYFLVICDCLMDDGCVLVYLIGCKGGFGIMGVWICKYIFFGGYFFVLLEIFVEIEKVGFWVIDCEILCLYYVYILWEWDKWFQVNCDKVVEMFDEWFCWMWEFYFIVSEFIFCYGNYMNFQIQLSKMVDVILMMCDYMLVIE